MRVPPVMDIVVRTIISRTLLNEPILDPLVRNTAIPESDSAGNPTCESEADRQSCGGLLGIEELSAGCAFGFCVDSTSL